MPKEHKNYALVLKPDGTEGGTYTGVAPRQAALKAANDSTGTKEKPVEISLREKGTKKVHVFKAWKAVVPAPKNKPAWMKDTINKPFVEKLRIEKIE